MEISKIKANPNNPRFIEKDKFEKLKKSLENFPEMMRLRPMVINADNVVLGGNMRLKALKELGYKDIPEDWVKSAEDLTEEQQREFIIKDNVGFGRHDWDMLANEWNAEELEEWGLDLPTEWGSSDIDYSDKNKEIDVDEFDDKMIIKLQYVEDEYHLVKDALLKIASTPEQAVYKLLGLDNE